MNDLNKMFKGYLSEMITKAIISCVSGKGKIIRNAYIPYNGKTSEIDIILIHETGIYVFENKAFKGYIFGSENQVYWTQCLYGGRKFKFYNPIMQNRTHINALRKVLSGKEPDKIKSYIVFSDECQLKQVPISTQEYVITNGIGLYYNLQDEIKNCSVLFSENDIMNIYNKLIQYTNANMATVNQHRNQCSKNAYYSR